MSNSEIIKISLENHVNTIQTTITECGGLLDILIDLFSDCFRKGNKLMLCGNGGSAADAQHIAGEFINRFRMNRKALPAIALTTDSSVMTAISNDIDFENIFSRQVEAHGRIGDILVAISTSGVSTNIIKALNTAHSLGVTTVGFTGRGGRERMISKCDYCLIVPSIDTPRIQEAHGFLWHIICEAVEATLFSPIN
jgi:D-sedoheptulose 7-phosphate isomerase